MKELAKALGGLRCAPGEEEGCESVTGAACTAVWFQLRDQGEQMGTERAEGRGGSWGQMSAGDGAVARAPGSKQPTPLEARTIPSC